MRLFVNIILALAALPLFAFDSDAWLLKRDEMTREAAVLRERYAQCAAKALEPAENVSVPIESHPDGSVKSSVVAKKAQFFLESGLVWGEDVVVSETKADGTLVSRIEADSCVVDRNAKAGWAEGRVKAVYGDTALEGEGVYLSFPKEYVAIFDKAKITSAKFDVDKRRKNAKGFTVLTSKRADYDRSEGVVMFNERVFLDNPEYKFASSQLFAFLKGTNDLRRVVALGNVSVTNGNNCGACDRAVFSRPKAKITMYAASDGKMAELCELGKDGKVRNRLEGEKISFWIDSEQVEVENSRITVDGGGKLKL